LKFSGRAHPKKTGPGAVAPVPFLTEKELV